MKKQFPIKKRNQLLTDFFQKLYPFCQIELIGNKNQPKIIITEYNQGEEKVYLVNGFVKNFFYSFTTKHYGGEVSMTININEIEDVDKRQLAEEINKQYRQNVFILKLVNQELYYTVSDDDLFSPIKKRYFFTIEEAESKQKQLIKRYNLHCQIIE